MEQLSVAVIRVFISFFFLELEVIFSVTVLTNLSTRQFGDSLIRIVAKFSFFNVFFPVTLGFHC